MVDYIVAVLGVSVLFLLVVTGVLWAFDWLVTLVSDALATL